MKKIIIFGDREIAELAHYYLTTDAGRQVECFTLHNNYLTKGQCCGLPIIPFEDVLKVYPAAEYSFFAPIYSSGIMREKIANEIRAHGYDLESYVSTKAHIWNAQLGSNCFIFEGVNIQPFCQVGNNVIIWSLTHVGHHGVIEDNVFMSSGVVVAGRNRVGKYSFLGSNSSTRDGTIIPEGTLIGMDSSVVKSPERAWGVYYGTPARYVRENPQE